MTAERTAEEWGRVAVSLPGWRWRPGMGLLPLPNEVAQLIRDNEAVGRFRYAGHTKDGPTVTHVRPSAVRRHVNLTKGHYHPVRAYFVPDPDDPATAGCLLALLGPGAWDNVAPGSAVAPDGEGWWAWVHGDWSEGMTLGRACIAVAEALGRWSGGAA